MMGWGTGINEWRVDGRKEDIVEGEENGICHFRYGIELIYWSWTM